MDGPCPPSRFQETLSFLILSAALQRTTLPTRISCFLRWIWFEAPSLQLSAKHHRKMREKDFKQATFESGNL